ncbi:hypothetical protein LWI29_030284 [Acer saccharum]|uniref:Peptidase C1A papain C-terminal domain-containing protein n=1 Tax=Acer saccharum TaxID=4024 RepID=A0AA39W3B6_ACESA|nr:hypothetical protein LWI29_030284 [Acer saccharum]
MASPSHLLFATIFLLFAAISTQEVIASKPVSKLKLNSKILQDSIIKKVNENPKAGWEATRNPRFSNYTGHCGSCWAFGAVESLSDRFCIHFGTNISLSVNDLLACCGFLCGDGCDGGYPINAWQYFKRHGLSLKRYSFFMFSQYLESVEFVFFIPFNASDFFDGKSNGYLVIYYCDPYFDDIGCSHPGCEPAYPTPKCVKKCVKGNQLWTDSKHFSVSAYRINSDPHDIMAEVYTNGPVEVAFTVYEDFAHYKSGVYKHITGDIMGGHAVKLIGWGTGADGADYWLLANQWNKGWGDDGYFKIRRATNECGIEEDVVAGLPSTKNLVREAIASKPVSNLKLNSKILQDSIIKKVNENPKAGWEAARNPRFSNYTVGEFKYLLGVKPTPEKELLGIPVVTHDKS